MTPGEVGQTFAELLAEELKKRPSDLERRIIANRVETAIRAWLKAGQTPPKPVPVMTDAEAEAYGGTPMRFGKFAGQLVRHVPLSYLAWLADASRETWQQLHAYLNSPQVHRQLAEEQGEDPDDQRTLF